MTKIFCFICAINCFFEGWIFTGFVLAYIVFCKEFKR